MNEKSSTSILIKTDVTSFRQNNWGDTNNDVIEKEGLDYRFNNESIILYENKRIIGLDCEISFSFKFSRLYFGNIAFLPKYNDLNEYVPLFYAIRDRLINSLGFPSGNESEWVNDRFKNNKNMIGHAIQIGDYSLSTGWMFPTNHIFLILDNSEDPISLRLSARAPH